MEHIQQSRGTSASIILAAGLSSRMGEPKALLPWHGVTLLEYAVAEHHGAGVDCVVVVLGHECERHRAVLPPATWLRVGRNLDYASGRASSIRCGAEIIPLDVSAIIVQSVDQPVSRTVLRTLVDVLQRTGTSLAIPVHQSRRGHPLALSGALRAELLEVTEETLGLRAIVQRHADSLVEVPFDETVLDNINSPDSYRAARAKER